MRIVCWVCIAVLVGLLAASCSPGSSIPPAPPTLAQNVSAPSARPPTWTPTAPPPTRQPTAGPTPLPTRTLTPPVTPGPMHVVVADDNAFSIEIPSNWTVSQGTRRVEGSTTYEVKYFAAIGPGDAPQPGLIIFYDWPSTLSTTNDNAWESAYALTSLVIKSCAMRISQQVLPVNFGDEPARGVEYGDACGTQGLLTGAVHDGTSYGALFEAPAPYYDEWFETLRQILLSLTFGR